MRKKRKIQTGWAAVSKENQKYEKQKLSWVSKYEATTNADENIIGKIVKFLIRLSLVFVISKKNSLNDHKKRSIVETTYDSLSSTKFAFIPPGVGLYFFLSLIPIMIISLSILSLFPDYSKVLIGKEGVLSRVIPGIQSMFVTIKLDSNFLKNAFLIFFVISILWFASKGITKFTDSLITMYEYNQNVNWFIKRLKGIFVVLLISLYLAGALIAYAPLMQLIVPFQKTNSMLFEFLFYITTMMYLLFFGYIGIGALFIMLPPFKIKWKQIHPGIITSLIPIVIFIISFGPLMKLFNYEKFGPIGTYVYLLIFVLYLSYFLHAGIIINSSYYKIYFYTQLSFKKSNVSKKILYLFYNMSIWFKNTFRRKR